jgi:hypothetical protein
MTDKGGYEVGWGKPPRHTRFPAERSGNPSGRRKSRPKSIKAIVEQVLDRKIRVAEMGKTTRRTIRQLIVSQLMAKAAKGDSSALRVLLEFQAFADKDKETGIIIEYVKDKKR